MNDLLARPHNPVTMLCPAAAIFKAIQDCAGPARSVDLPGQLGSACQSFLDLRQETKRVRRSVTETRGRLVISSPCDSNAAAVVCFRAPLSHPMYQSFMPCPAVAILRATHACSGPARSVDLPGRLGPACQSFLNHRKETRREAASSSLVCVTLMLQQ
jgi:hypothetical protein